MQEYTRRDLLKVAIAATAETMATEMKIHGLERTQSSEVRSALVGLPQLSIITPKDADLVLQFAAQDLAQYLRQITGRPVIDQGAAGKEHQIFLGALPATVEHAEAMHIDEELKALNEDGFIIRSIGPDVVILGKGSRGILYGCYAYLELQGVRWYFPGRQYEIVPRRAIEWDIHLHVNESPAFPKRILFYWPNNYCPVIEWIDFCGKMRLNRLGFHYTWPARDWYLLLRSELLPELQKRGMEVEVGGHFLSTFLPRTLFPKHPEWFRMNEEGQRTNDFNLNPFSHEALDYLASGAVQYLQQMPEAKLFHLWADDIEGRGWSHEPGKESYSPSDQALLVSNIVLRSVRGELPGAKLAYLAYHDTVAPPRVVEPEHGLVYLYAPRERCYAHQLNDPICGLNRKYSQSLEEVLPRFGSANAEVFEYYADEILYEGVTNPPMPDVIGADLAYYRKLGIPAVGALMTQPSNFLSPLVNMFLYPQGLWNPDRNLNLSLDEYARLYFGDGRLSDYFLALSHGMKEVLAICAYNHPGDAWDSVKVDRESDNALRIRVSRLEAALLGMLAQAAHSLERCVSQATDATYRARLQGEQASMSFTCYQLRAYYHLLKGEYLYRVWTSSRDQEAGLALLVEVVLARYIRSCQEKLVAATGMKAFPMLPSLQYLEAKAATVTRLISIDPGSVVGVNISGFAIDRLDGHLLEGITGYMIAGPTGSRAVLWTEVASSRFALRTDGPSLLWFDEYRRPIPSGVFDLFISAAVAEANGTSVDKLYSALLRGQLILQGRTDPREHVERIP
jgi:hypothetical protein